MVQRIDDAQRFIIPGSKHPFADSRLDRGRADTSLNLERLTLVLKPSDAEQAALDRLLTELHDPKSGNYHKWLTPESYAERFGASLADIAAIGGWLAEHGLTVTGVSRARNAITVSGTVGCVEEAFHTEIHAYAVEGETRYANATEPSLPRAFEGIVLAIHGLHDFRLQPRSRMFAPAAQRRSTRDDSSQTAESHYLTPDDFATIFNIKPLYGAGIDGSGQKIVIVGQSRIDVSHLNTFRSHFGLGDADVSTTLVPDTRDPGYRQADAQETDLDLQWASAIARSARLEFVYSYDVTDAVQYAIDQNLAPILSMSYGECETSSTLSDALTMRTWAKQANAQGITWVASSGDSGAAGCYPSNLGPFRFLVGEVNAATDVPASIPEVTAIGGTTLNEGDGVYWAANSESVTKASALTYIPETSWNDSTTNNPASSGGGASQFFTRPSWQTGYGMPSDDSRYVPDVALPASAEHDATWSIQSQPANQDGTSSAERRRGLPHFRASWLC